MGFNHGLTLNKQKISTILKTSHEEKQELKGWKEVGINKAGLRTQGATDNLGVHRLYRIYK